jgi:hypothetical protein
MVKKMSKKKVDISFLNPETMEVVCTFNGCVDKFTKEDYEVYPKKDGKELVQAFHVCEECGRRAKANGDGKKGYKKWLELQRAKGLENLDPETRLKVMFHEHNIT